MIQRLFQIGAITICFTGLLSANACTSAKSTSPGKSTSATPTATDSYDSMDERADHLYPLFIQCLARKKVRLRSNLESKKYINVAKQGTEQGWYSNGKVRFNQDFVDWAHHIEEFFPANPELKPSSKDVYHWVTDAATKKIWPTKLCGPLPR